ncbi:MAG: hypothetical protein Q9210_005224 [Variospora velana]
MASPNSVDVLIIGGGPAGLTAALTLARQLHTVLVFDSHKYRNDGSDHMHTVLTWDHKAPSDFRQASRDNILSGYQTVRFEDTAVQTVTITDHGFEATDTVGKVWVGRKLILASGVTDVYPDIEGYDDCWVKGITSSGVLAVGDLEAVPPALHFARNALQLTPKAVTLYTNGNDSLRDALTTSLDVDSKITVDNRTINRLEKGPSRAQVILHFSDGSQAVQGFLAHKPKCQLTGPFAQQLGLDLTPQGDIKTTPPFYQTSVRGAFTAGDTSYPVKIANNALFTGAAAAAGVAAQLQADNMGHKSMV